MKVFLASIAIAVIAAISPVSSSALDIKDLVSSITGSDSPSIEKMVGNWSYSSPAVSFKSGNILKKAGGAAASSVVEDKLEPYFKKAGLTSMTLEIAADSTFTMKVKKVTLKGNISTINNDDKSGANFIFNFKAAGKVSVGKMNAYVTLSGDSSMTITFDVTKLVSLIDKIASISGNSTAKGVSAVLKGYDGICAGFKLHK